MDLTDRILSTDNEGREYKSSCAHVKRSLSAKDPFFIVLLSAAILFLLISRIITVTHNMDLHQDESAFYESANSLMRFLSGRENSYSEVKEYPEGAIVLQLPFHIAASLFRHATGIDLSLRLRGRIASILYFVFGAVLGSLLEYRFIGKNKSSVLAYFLILVFSVMHIEQSRYGTGDPISFFLMMAILYLTAIGVEKSKKKRWLPWLCAGFLCGLLCAVKYPLLFWAVIPITVAWNAERGADHRRGLIPALIACAVPLGFLFASPKVAVDPAYIIRVCFRELNSYSGSDYSGVGSPLSHLVSVTLYAFFYAGFPFAPIFAALAIKEGSRFGKKDSPTSFLFNRLLPSLIILFFVYNLFVRNLAMRTYYPLFFLVDLYVAAYLGKQSGRKTKTILCILTFIFLARGIYFIAALTEKTGAKNLRASIVQATDDSWQKTTFLNPGTFIYYHIGPSIAHSIEPESKRLTDPEFEDSSRLALGPGELLITGSIERFFAGHWEDDLFPVGNSEASTLNARWADFKRINRSCFVGSAYPSRYYYLFGYWLKGTSGSYFEFPTNYVYYRSAY